MKRPIIGSWKRLLVDLILLLIVLACIIVVFDEQQSKMLDVGELESEMLDDRNE